MSLLFVVQGPHSECGMVFFTQLFPTWLSFLFFFLFLPLLVFLTSCSRRTGKFLPLAWRLCLPPSLTICLCLFCVKMFWQIVPVSVNKVPMTERKAATRKETIWFMNIDSLWGPFLPGLFPSFFLPSLLLSCFLLGAWQEISLLKDFKRHKMSHLTQCESYSSSQRASDPLSLSTPASIKDDLGPPEKPASPCQASSWLLWAPGCAKALWGYPAVVPSGYVADELQRDEGHVVMAAQGHT